MYKLLIIDDEPLVQAGIRSMVRWNELNIEICGVASNGQVGLDIIEKEQPDIVITDIKMPVMTGLELLKIVRERYGSIHPAFIVLTSYEDFQLAKEAISYTIIDYLVKIELTPDTLKAAVEKALHILMESSQETNQNQKLSQTDMQSLKDKFFIRLLHNLYDSEEQFDLLRRDLNIPFSYCAFQCCYFEMMNEKADLLSMDQQITLYANSFHLLQEITTKYQKAYFVTLDRKHGVIIFLYEENTTDSKDTITLILKQISDSLYHYYSTSLKCGIGNVVSSPLAIADSYTNARHAFATVKDASHVASYEDFSGEFDSHAVFHMAFFKDDLGKAFSEYDSLLLSDVLTQIITLFKENPTHYVQALDAACNILFLAISLIPNGDELLTELFHDMPDGYRSIYKQKTTSQVVSWLNTFKERLCQSFQEHKKEHRHHIVESVKKYIETHLQDRLNLNEVSAIYGISPNYLSSLFKKYNDCGYSEYITYRKIEEAKKMMMEKNKKVYEIANALGFESAFYFSKVFKKVEGISPSEFINK